MADKEWIGLTVLGKVIGTHTGWDEVENCYLQFYDYIPNALGMQFIRGQAEADICLSVNFTEGTVFIYNDTTKDVTEVEKPDWSVFNKE